MWMQMYWRDFSGDIDIFCDFNFVRFKRIFQVYVFDLFVKGCFGVDQMDQIVFYGEKNICVFFNFFFDDVVGGDKEFLVIVFCQFVQCFQIEVCGVYGFGGLGDRLILLILMRLLE